MTITWAGLAARLALLGALWAVLPAAAPAEVPAAAVRSEQKSAMFRAMDTNGDGIITKLEYDAKSTAFVKELAGRDPDLARRFLALTPEQQQVRFDLRFAAMDANRDGRIDDREWETAQPGPLLPG